MKVFVTGSTGLLGSTLVRMLRAQGHEVTALVRSPEKAAVQLGGLDVSIVRGDMQDVKQWATALQGHDVLFHTAAYFREYYQPGDHWQTLQAINIDGTMNLLRAAEQYGVGKVIYTSSSGVIGMQRGKDWGDETSSPDPETLANEYFRSKVIAEERIAEFLRGSKLPVVLILPGWMWGPGDAAPTSAGQLVLDFLNQKLPGVLDGGGSPVDVRDVAHAMLTAVERGKSGERYIVGGDRYLKFKEINAALARASGVAPPRLPIPFTVALVYAWFAELRSRLTGKPTLVTISAVRTIRYHRLTRSAKAERELGATFRPFETTVRDTVAWYRANKPELVAKGRAPRQAASRS